MPPWKAEPGYGNFIGLRPLSDDELDILQRWVADGAPEGDARDLPPAPRWSEGWRLGQPDLVVTLPEPYTLQARDTDVFRTFVIPLPGRNTRFVKGLEFHPGNAVIHHANILIDRTAASRELDEQDPEPGYEGVMALSAAYYPDGQFLSWTPGQAATMLQKGLAWRLDADTDLVVVLHMQPSGKTEVVQPSIGFFFDADPPERGPAILRLARQNIDIPAGKEDYTITDSYVLPVDVEVQAVQPHAHNLAHEIRGMAVLPDGSTRWLIYIKDWDFRWQHVYRYVEPFSLPKGTTLSMQYTYDNSAGNPRNPQHPPKRVLWGQQTSDEMGDLWIQVLTRNAHDLTMLTREFRRKQIAEDVIGYETIIRSAPRRPGLHDAVAQLYLEMGKLDEAITHLEASVNLKTESPSAHFNLGTVLTLAGRIGPAIAQYERALQIKPDYTVAHNNLGGVLLRLGRTDEALAHFREALRIDPLNVEAFYNRGSALQSRGQFADAIAQFRQAVQLRPDWVPAMTGLAWLLAAAPNPALRDTSQAIGLAERAAKLTGQEDASVLDILAVAYAASGQFDRAVATLEAALALKPDGTLAVALRLRQDLFKQRRPYVLPEVPPGI